MDCASKARLLLLFTVVGVSSAQKSTKSSPSAPATMTVERDSYGVYSALLTQRYREWFRRNVPVRIAAYTTAPDRDHGDLIARCSSGADNATDRELIQQLLSANTRPHRLEAKLALPGQYLIVDGKVDIREGSEPGVVWLSAVSFSKDKRHAMVWMRNFCGGLCGSGLMWKLDRSTKGWRVADSVPNCGFIS
jgi:hypothetical protein